MNVKTSHENQKIKRMCICHPDPPTLSISPHQVFARDIRIVRSCWNNMAPGKLFVLLQLPTGALRFLSKKMPFYLGISNTGGTKG